MSAYVVIELDVTDAEGFQQYIDGVNPLIDKVGARNILVDPDTETLEGDWAPPTLVIHEFPSKQAVLDFWNSPEYEPFKDLRRKYSSVKVVVAESS